MKVAKSKTVHTDESSAATWKEVTLVRKALP